MNKVDQKLVRLNNEIHRREKLRIHLTHLDEMIAAKKVEMDKLAITVAKEEDDVLALENVTIYTLFSVVLGTLERQLEKERQEYLHALLIYKGVKKNYQSLKKEKELLVKSLNGLHAIEREFKRILKLKEEILEKVDSYPEDLVVLNDRISNYTIQIKEIVSAVKKGETAKRYLHKVILSLKQMQHWGFEGRDLKHGNMQRKSKATQKEMYTANNFLQKYEDQLHDISVYFGVDFHRQIKNLEAFLERFVDSLITDWVVNNKIENSIHMVNNMIDTITKLNGSLDYQKAKVKEFRKEDNELKAQIILDLIDKNKS